ncbi:hypothetical protein L596_024537 [Steinernema carpocapsae]|uniref:Uncharacterized protein n=1 Tax=Steinernema carpocapsae TaxID=34508 RepID=A0A4U5MI72_STECR|nr:hypothetical protein L596_024537 [Steinernema carpocapsae]
MPKYDCSLAEEPHGAYYYTFWVLFAYSTLILLATIVYIIIFRKHFAFACTKNPNSFKSDAEFASEAQQSKMSEMSTRRSKKESEYGR